MVLESLVSLAGITVLQSVCKIRAFVVCLLVFFSSPFGDFKFSLPTDPTFSAVAVCFFLSLPLPQVSSLYVIDTSILTAIAFASAWFKCCFVQKLNLGGETKPHRGLTSGVDHQESFCHLALASTPYYNIWGRYVSYILPRHTIHTVQIANKNTCSVYVFLERKEFLFTSPTSLRAYLWVERRWTIAQLRSRITLGRGQCGDAACCLPWGSRETGKETVIWWIRAISDSSRGRAVLSCCLSRSGL